MNWGSEGAGLNVRDEGRLDIGAEGASEWVASLLLNGVDGPDAKRCLVSFVVGIAVDMVADGVGVSDVVGVDVICLAAHYRSRRSGPLMVARW